MATRQTRSFIILCILALILVYVSILVSKKLPKNTAQYNTSPVPADTQVAKPTPTTISPAALDTSTWGTYTDPTYPLTFKYPAAWSVQSFPPTDNFAWYTITIAPTKTATSVINIYVNQKSYFAFEGIQTYKTKINNYDVTTASTSLMGIKQGKYFYTFDAGMDANITPFFEQMMKTVIVK